MTDYKQLCAELLETIDLLTEGDSRPESAAISSARTMLAQPEQAGEVTSCCAAQRSQLLTTRTIGGANWR
jgi:hypothetical protein